MEQPLSEWLNEYGLIFVLDDDHIIDGQPIPKPTWTGRHSTRASSRRSIGETRTSKSNPRTKDKLKESIQYRAIAEPKTEDWDVILDDDGSGHRRCRCESRQPGGPLGCN